MELPPCGLSRELWSFYSGCKTEDELFNRIDSKNGVYKFVKSIFKEFDANLAWRQSHEPLMQKLTESLDWQISVNGLQRRKAHKIRCLQQPNRKAQVWIEGSNKSIEADSFVVAGLTSSMFVSINNGVLEIKKSFFNTKQSINKINKKTLDNEPKQLKQAIIISGLFGNDFNKCLNQLSLCNKNVCSILQIALESKQPKLVRVCTAFIKFSNEVDVNVPISLQTLEEIGRIVRQAPQCAVYLNHTAQWDYEFFERAFQILENQIVLIIVENNLNLVNFPDVSRLSNLSRMEFINCPALVQLPVNLINKVEFRISNCPQVSSEMLLRALLPLFASNPKIQCVVDDRDLRLCVRAFSFVLDTLKSPIDKAAFLKLAPTFSVISKEIINKEERAYEMVRTAIQYYKLIPERRQEAFELILREIIQSPSFKHPKLSATLKQDKRIRRFIREKLKNATYDECIFALSLNISIDEGVFNHVLNTEFKLSKCAQFDPTLMQAFKFFSEVASRVQPGSTEFLLRSLMSFYCLISEEHRSAFFEIVKASEAAKLAQPHNQKQFLSIISQNEKMSEYLEASMRHATFLGCVFLLSYERYAPHLNDEIKSALLNTPSLVDELYSSNFYFRYYLDDHLDQVERLLLFSEYYPIIVDECPYIHKMILRDYPEKDYAFVYARHTSVVETNENGRTDRTLLIWTSFDKPVKKAYETLYWLARNIRAYSPTSFWISYVGQPGVDLGGLRRDFFGRHGEAIADRLKIRHEIPLWNREQNGIFENLGTLFSFLILIGEPMGDVMAPELFSTLLEFTYEEVIKDFDQLSPVKLVDSYMKSLGDKDASKKTLESLNQLKRIVKWNGRKPTPVSAAGKSLIQQIQQLSAALCISYPQHIDLTDFKAADLDVIKQLLVNEIVGDYAKKLQTAHAIARGMVQSPADWLSYQKLGSEKLLTSILGVFDRQKLKEVITFQESVTQEVRDNLFEWMDTCSEEKLRKFVKYLNGSVALPKEIKVVKSDTAAGICASSCFFMLELPAMLFEPKEVLEKWLHLPLREWMFESLDEACNHNTGFTKN